MGRVHTYLIFSIVIMILFYMMGFSTVGSYVIETLQLTPDGIGNFSHSSFMVLLGSAIALFAIGAVGATIGLFPKTFIDYTIIGVMGAPLLALIGDMVLITSYAVGNYGVVGYAVFILFAPVIVGYSLSLMDWIRGND